MTTINATKGEFVNLINGLFQVQELKGKNFGLVVSKNITILRKKLQHLEELGKPSEEFMKLAVQVNEIAANDPDGSKEIIDQLEEDNKELVEKRREQMENVTERMKEKMSVKLKTLSTDILPEDITAQQISNLEQIIK
jgi:hypothetical protein